MALVLSPPAVLLFLYFLAKKRRKSNRRPGGWCRHLFTRRTWAGTVPGVWNCSSKSGFAYTTTSITKGRKKRFPWSQDRPIETFFFASLSAIDFVAFIHWALCVPLSSSPPLAESAGRIQSVDTLLTFASQLNGTDPVLSALHFLTRWLQPCRGIWRELAFRLI